MHDSCQRLIVLPTAWRDVIIKIVAALPTKTRQRLWTDRETLKGVASATPTESLVQSVASRA